MYNGKTERIGGPETVIQGASGPELPKSSVSRTKCACIGFSVTKTDS